MRPPVLNPAQQDVLDRLGAPRASWPDFDAGLRAELRARLEAELEPALTALPEGEAVWVSKHGLATVHGCEARWQAEDDAPFVANAATVRGAVAHKAIELSVAWRGEPTPLELVDEALAGLTESDHWVADFLRRATEAERAEVRGLANERVASFLECWPRLNRRWIPVPEARMRADLCDGRVIVRGRVDLTLGRAEGTRAGKVLVDFKTGGWSPAHHEDLRLYALVETLRLGTPPRRLATAYLDSGTLHTEDVTVGGLDAAAARLADGVARMVDLRHGGAEAVLRPSVACRWCSLLTNCDTGRAHLGEAARTDPDDFDDLGLGLPR
jgi:PD-(D/E)XK nuclease superfamily